MIPTVQTLEPAPLLYFAAAGAEVPTYLEKPFRKFPSDGPNGLTGTLLSACPGSLEYLPAVQTWVPMAGNGLFLGFQRSELHRLKPATFARSSQIAGHMATLGDGNAWLIPAARLAAGGTNLPRRRAFAPNGSVVWDIEAAFRGLSDFAGLAWDANRGKDVELSQEEMDRYCGEALSVNYRLHWPEAVALGLFTAEGQRAIVSALIDWPTIEAIMTDQKKTSAG